MPHLAFRSAGNGRKCRVYSGTKCRLLVGSLKLGSEPNYCERSRRPSPDRPKFASAIRGSSGFGDKKVVSSRPTVRF